jgi:hypothetical protein
LVGATIVEPDASTEDVVKPKLYAAADPDADPDAEETSKENVSVVTPMIKQYSLSTLTFLIITASPTM